MMALVLTLFPLWAILLSALAYFVPTLFSGSASFIVPLLIIIMLSMGMTLRFKDFMLAVKDVKSILIGVILQFLVMPLTAFVVSKMLTLSDELLVGMVIVGSVGGGTASNVIAYLAKANVALSVTLTAISTLLGVLITPLLVKLYVGSTVEVSVLSMILSLVKIVLAPVFVGVCIRAVFHKAIDNFRNVPAFVAMVSILLVIAIVVALNQSKLFANGAFVFLAVMLHNVLGLFLGYLIARFCGCKERDARTISIEVGMQNSGLGVALAIKYFSAATAIPGAIFSAWHNISGSLLASWWSSKPSREA